MIRAIVRRGKLTISLSDEARRKLRVHDGDLLDVTSENGRIVLTPVAEQPLPDELEALDEAEQEFARGETRRLSDVLDDLRRKIKSPG
jgi:antitoxin component of MazEF toxin-antitoxin module